MSDSTNSRGLLSLNDDILWEIIVVVAAVDHVPRQGLYLNQKAIPRLESSLLSTFCMTCKYIRFLASPKLYRTATVGKRRIENLDHLGLFHSINQSVEAHQYVKNFDLELEGNVKDIPACAVQLVALLQQLSNLEDIAVVISPNKKPEFMSAIHLTSLQVESVERATLSHGQESLVSWFPNLSSLCIHGTRNGPFEATKTERLLEALDHAPGLRHFEYRCFWNEKYLKDLLAHAPHLQTIAVIKIRDRHSFTGLLPYLAQFQQLKSLTVAPVYFLGMGVPVIVCGNMFMRPGGAEAKKEMERKIETAQHQVADKAFQACKCLEVLRIGSNVEVKRARDYQTENLVWSKRTQAR